MNKTIIGITLDSSEQKTYSTFPWYALRKDYSRVITEFGAVPIFISHDEIVMNDMLDLVDGLLITGGDADIHPEFYGQEIKYDEVEVNYSRSKFEIDITKKALKRNMPILGICNGLQILNIIYGGTLMQHIPKDYKTDIEHLQETNKDIPCHGFTVQSDTKLLQMTKGQTEFQINSTHHQAIDKIGLGLIVSGLSEDGIIDSVEDPERDYVMAFEWHPEYMQTPILDDVIFQEFINASNRFKEIK